MSVHRQKFEGADVLEVRSRVVGRVGDARLDAPLAPGAEVVVVSVGFVKSVGHEQTDAGLVRVQRLAVSEGFVLVDETDAADLIHKLRADRRRALDDLLGTPPLDGLEES